MQRNPICYAFSVYSSLLAWLAQKKEIGLAARCELRTDKGGSENGMCSEFMRPGKLYLAI